jgi:prepilin signal peptidase PulO-like enzyme (type II secretory pathway)
MSEVAVQKPIDLFPCPVSLHEDDKDCAICLDTNDQTSLTHGVNHRWHKKCIIEWMNQDKTCPSCRTPIAYSFASKTEKIAHLTTNFSRNVSSGASTGLNYVHNYHVFATFAAAAAASLYAGKWTEEILTCLGMGSAVAATLGIVSRLLQSDGAATETTKMHAHFWGTCGSMVAAIAFFSNAMHESIPLSPFQVLGAFTILHNAGKSACTKGALLASSIAAAILPMSWYIPLKPVSIAAAILGGTSGAFFRTKTEIDGQGTLDIRKVPLPLTLIAMATGLIVAKTTAKHFADMNPFAGALIGGALGGMYASATSEVLDKGYDSYKKSGYALV